MSLARLKGSAPFTWLPPSWRRALLALLSIPASRALAKFDSDQAVRREVLQRIADQTPHFDRIGLDIGYVYEDGALVPDGSVAPKLEDGVTHYAPSAAPGARFPHLWLDPDHTRSTHDVLESTGYTLLLGDEGARWEVAVRALGPLQSSMKIDSLSAICDGAAASGALREMCGISSQGALLIRPDGHVAWRESSLTASPEETLRRVFEGCHIQ